MITPLRMSTTDPDHLSGHHHPNLQEQHNKFAACHFDHVDEDNGIEFAANVLRQFPASIIANASWWRSDEPWDGILL